MTIENVRRGSYDKGRAVEHEPQRRKSTIKLAFLLLSATNTIQYTVIVLIIGRFSQFLFSDATFSL